MTKRTGTAQQMHVVLPQINPTTAKNNNVVKKSTRKNDKPHYHRVKAVYPYITGEAFLATLYNYKQYVSSYNKLITKENKTIKSYNSLVDKFHSENQIEKAYLHIIDNFEVKHKSENTWHYNDMVEKANLNIGKMLIKKKNIQRIMPQVIITFKAAIYSYNKQLAEINRAKRATKNKAYVSVPRMEFNSGKIKALREHGLNILDSCTKTIRNHRKRLEEAQIFRDYSFHGNEQGTQLHFNNQILVIMDEFEKKVTSFDNQQVNEKQRKLFTDNNILTISKYNIENKEEKRSSHTLTELTFSSTGTHASKFENPQTAAEKTDLNLPQNSHDLRKYLIPPHILSENLANGDYFDAPHIEKKYLQNEAINGILSEKEMQQVLINYFFMKISKLYNGRTASKFSWKLAIDEWHSKLFKNNNNSYKSKTNMVALFDVYLNGINEVFKYSENNKEWHSLYPNQYFSLLRRDAGSGGFIYFASEKWSIFLSSQEKLMKQKHLESLAAKERKSKQTHFQRLQKQIRLHLNGKRSIAQLTSYVRHNMPPHIIDDFENILESEKLMLQERKKAA